MRMKEPPRVLGPYQERQKWRIVVVENGKRKSVFLDTEAEAFRAKAELERTTVRPISQRMGDVIDLWEQELLRSGLVKPINVIHKTRWVRKVLGSVLDEKITAMTPRKAAAIYAQVQTTPAKYRGAVLAVATQRYALWVTRNFFAWACEVGCVSVNPFINVKPVGKMNVGKPQLRIEEARRFTQVALERFEATGNPLTIGALVALMMGLRTQEVMLRQVRDLDDGGRFLWIDGGKTANAKRHLEVPELLRSYLLRVAAGQPPTALLFGEQKNGKPKHRQYMWKMVRQLCTRAGVPPVCTHSLRGLHATLAVQSGSAAHVIAASLGHGSFEITQRHYAQASAVANAATTRVQNILESSHDPGDDVVEALVTQLTAQLPPDVCMRIAQRLAAPKSLQEPLKSPHQSIRNRSVGTKSKHFTVAEV